MSEPPKGKSDYLALGDWNAQCWECSGKFKASVMKKHWKGYWVCTRCWEPRQPQDFVKAVPDIQAPPWTQSEPAPDFVPLCTPNGQCAVPGYMTPGCAKPAFISPMNTIPYYQEN